MADIKYIETSAKNSTNVEQVFEFIATELISSAVREEPAPEPKPIQAPMPVKQD